MSEAAIDRIFEWDESQQRAIDRCCDMNERVVAVTGPAGTGKTSLIREVYKTISEAGYSVVLAAPTGKAAKRITEATGINAMTIHRLLEYPFPGERDPETGKALSSSDPKRDRQNPLTQRVVLVDEYAMVNHEVHRNLIAALPRGGRLCMFGDVNQLKPIEQGKLIAKPSPFEYALDKFKGKSTVFLETIHRQQEGSGIALNGDRILRGQIPRRLDDFALRITERPVDVVEELVMEDPERFLGNAGQIITCTKASWIGTYKLNVTIQGLLNYKPVNDRLVVPRHRWDKDRKISVAVGDKVIWTKNTYDLRNPWDKEEDGLWTPVPAEKMIMNGESGRIVDIDHESGDLMIDVGDRVVEVPHTYTIEDSRGRLMQVDPRKDMDLGFCITTHKAQGSEWRRVVYVINRTTSGMHSRHNLYTAISRAREHVTIVTDQFSLSNSVQRKMSAIEQKQMEGR